MKSIHLTIDNIPGRGYDFVSKPQDIKNDMLREIWRNALPRGSAWQRYSDVHILKAFPVHDFGFAISMIVVKMESDDFGRKGVLKAEIDLMGSKDYLLYLDKISNKSQNRVKSLKMNQLVPKLVLGQQIILTRRYLGWQDWSDNVEATIAQLVLSLPLRLNLKISFTTFALDHLGESQIVAIPYKVAEDSKIKHSIYLS